VDARVEPGIFWFDPRAAAKRELFGFFERKGKDLAPILDARDAVRAVGKA
jgi:hypothetical protein